MVGIPKPKKEKKTSRKRLVALLDKELSLLVRERDKQCVICGSRERLTAGHVLSRSHYSTRWDFGNVFTQCWPCNYRHVHDTVPYFRWYVQSFSQGTFDNLYERWQTIRKFKDSELKEMLEMMRDR